MAFFYFVCFDWVVTVLMNCEMYYANGASGICFFIIFFVGFIGLLNWVGHVLLSERSHLSSV